MQETEDSQDREHSDAPTPEEADTIDAPESGAGAPSTPERIGRYEVRRAIDSGGMGTVYEGLHDELQQTVAIKVMQQRVISPDAIERFRHEAMLLAHLRHPGIAQVHDAGTYDDDGRELPYYVMEYIPNPLSITRYARDRNLSIRERLELFVRICDAVHHANIEGIVHRDLKPSNILVDSHAQPKIIDFGVSRASTRFGGELDAHGMLIGSYQYMSPEQVEPDPRDIDARSDVYALGVVLFELLTGRVPYSVQHKNIKKRIDTIRHARAPKLSSINPALGGDLEYVVKKALAKNREDRLNSVEMLKEGIQCCLDDQPLPASVRPSTPAYVAGAQAQRLMRHHPVWSGLFIVAIAFLIVEALGAPLVYKWTQLNEGAKWLVSRFPMSWQPEPFESVRVVRVTDETVARIPELGRRFGLDDLDAGNIICVRALNGKVMERLSTVGIRVLVMDFDYPPKDPPSRYSTVMAEGVKKLKAANVDVVVGVREWPLGSTPAVIDPAFRDLVRWGVTTVEFLEDEPWFVHLTGLRGGADPIQSLSLEALSCIERPGWKMRLRHADDHTLEVRYYRDPEPGTGVPQWYNDGRPSRVTLSSTLDFELRKDIGAFGRQAGDRHGILMVDVPPQEVLETVSYDYAWLLEASQQELEEAFREKAVVIGDGREGWDQASHPDGRVLHKCYGHAAALDAMLQDATFRVEGDVFSRGATLLMAVVGVIVAVVPRRPTRRALLAAGVIIIAAMIAPVFAFTVLHYYFNPLLPLGAFILAFVLALFVSRARQSRPALDAPLLGVTA